MILLTRSTSNLGEEVFMLPIDGEKSVWVTSCFFFNMSFSKDIVHSKEAYAISAQSTVKKSMSL